MSNRDANGRSKAPVRQPTPASPSPSPEPPDGGTNHHNANANNFSADTALDSLDVPDPQRSAAKGQLPFHEALNLGQDDPSDVYRQEAEDQIRTVIDSLYDLAACSADVQPNQEELVTVKVNETISRLSTLFNTSQQHSDTNLLPFIPQEILEAVDEGRNPDAWSKNRMARLLSDNQQLAGQRWAIENYRALLTRKVNDVFPEMADALSELQDEHSQLRTRTAAATHDPNLHMQTQ